MIVSVLRRFVGGAARTLVLAVACASLAGAVLAAPSFPKLTGRVVDDAHILTPGVQSALTEKLAKLETQSRRQLVVVTLASLQGLDIADYGYQLGRHWGIGQRAGPNAPAGAEKDNGVLFIVAPAERKVRIEVGYGLEPILTDALSSVILQTKVLPRFKAGDMSGGVVAGTDALIQQLSLPEDQARAAAEQAPKQIESGSGDGGLAGLVPVLVILFIVFAMSRRRGRGAGWLAPIIIGGLSRRGRDWGGGDWGGSSGSGGFRGGGGSFGGGGASGGW